MNVDGDAAAVVDHGNGVVDVNRDRDCVAVSGQRFINRVIDDFIHQVMQARFHGGSDVHGRAQADSLQTFENLDAGRIVNSHWCHFFGCHSAPKTLYRLLTRAAPITCRPIARRSEPRR